MRNGITKQKMKNIYVENAIRSLYQFIMEVNIPKGKGRIIDCNKEFRYFLNSDGDYDPFYSLLYENIHPEDRERFAAFAGYDDIPERLETEVFISMECRIRQADSRYKWSEIIICNADAEDKAGGDDHLFLIRDIDKLKKESLKREKENRLVLSALQNKYDSLFEENMTDQQTGCYNRKGLKYYTEIVLKEAEDEGRAVFVCVADLNSLKYINDTYGHAAGDEAIRAVSSALIEAAPEGSKIVRTGGDEFLIFAALAPDSREPEEMDVKIQKIITDYNATHSNPYDTGVSYGWVLESFGEGMTDLDDLIEVADKKMYEMKCATDKHKRER